MLATLSLFCAAARADGEIEAPTQDEAVGAFVRNAAYVFDKMGLLGADNEARYAQQMGKINVFATRLKLDTCNQRTGVDETFNEPGTPKRPVVFDCRWSTGERISFTRVGSTGAWAVSDQATTAEGMGMVFAGPRPAGVETQVASIKIAPIIEVPKAPEAPSADPGVTRTLVPSLGTAAALGKPIATPKDLPSPFVAPGGAAAAPAPVKVDPGPMPTPFASAR